MHAHKHTHTHTHAHTHTHTHTHTNTHTHTHAHTHTHTHARTQAHTRTHTHTHAHTFAIIKLPAIRIVHPETLRKQYTLRVLYFTCLSSLTTKCFIFRVYFFKNISEGSLQLKESKSSCFH